MGAIGTSGGNSHRTKVLVLALERESVSSASVGVCEAMLSAATPPRILPESSFSRVASGGDGSVPILTWQNCCCETAFPRSWGVVRAVPRCEVPRCYLPLCAHLFSRHKLAVYFDLLKSIKVFTTGNSKGLSLLIGSIFWSILELFGFSQFQTGRDW